MSKPTFFYHNKKYYNVNQIVFFETIGATHNISMSNGEKLEINSGHIKFNKAIYVINPPAFEDNGGKYEVPPSQ